MKQPNRKQKTNEVCLLANLEAAFFIYQYLTHIECALEGVMSPESNHSHTVESLLIYIQ